VFGGKVAGRRRRVIGYFFLFTTLENEKAVEVTISNRHLYFQIQDFCRMIP
jgi:hypothetical protein